MAKAMIQVNSYGDRLTWITGAEVEATYAEDETRDDSIETCATCDRPIEPGQAYRRCVDTGDEIHAGCSFPNW